VKSTRRARRRGEHEHVWHVIASTRTASGDWLVVRRCSCGSERHSTEDEPPDEP
jgi:hypothetical protein